MKKSTILLLIIVLTVGSLFSYHFIVKPKWLNIRVNGEELVIGKTSVEELISTGIEMDPKRAERWKERESIKLDPGERTSVAVDIDYRKTHRLRVGITNNSIKPQTFMKSSVSVFWYEEYEKAEGQGKPDLLIADQITMGSSAEEIEAVLGKPDKIKDERTIVVLRYQHRNYVGLFTISKSSNELNKVIIGK